MNERNEQRTMSLEGWLPVSQDQITLRNLLKAISDKRHIVLRKGECLSLEVTLKPRPKTNSASAHYRAEIEEAC